MKTALITGASRGIGYATAIKFAQAGFNTIINCKESIKDLMALADRLNEYPGKCLPIQSDVSNPKEVADMFQEIQLIYDGVDIIVNNAGISLYALINDVDIDTWHKVMNTNLNSAYYITKQALPYMIQNKSGSIVNISSIWGTYGASMEVAYATSKAGLNGFTKALAREVGPSGIRVNAVALGAVDTSMNSRFSKEEMTAFTDEIALGRIGNTEEVAETIFHVATKATYMTGEIVHLDGGY